MSSRILASVLTLGSVLLASSETSAQFVRRGLGGRVIVRAPFVGVDVDPYGGTVVRAPFVGVVTSGSAPLPPAGYGPAPYGYAPYGYAPYGYAPYGGGPAPGGYAASAWYGADLDAAYPGRGFIDPYGAPPQGGMAPPQGVMPAQALEPMSAPSNLAQELRGLDEEGLRTALAGAWQQFDESLKRLEDGAGWRTYLELPKDDAPAGWAQVARRVESLRREAQFARITSQPGFGQLEALLAEKLRRLEPSQPTTAQPTPAPQQKPAPPQKMEPTLAEPEGLEPTPAEELPGPTF